MTSIKDLGPGLSSSGGEKGVVLVTALLVMLVLLPLGAAFLSVSMMETTIASNEVGAARGFYLAEAGIEHAKKRLESLNPSAVLDGTDGIFGKGKGKGQGAQKETRTLPGSGGGKYTVLVSNNLAPDFPRGPIPVDPSGDADEDSDRIVVVTSTGTFQGGQQSIEVVVQMNSFPMVPGAVIEVSRGDGGNNEFDVENTSRVSGFDESGTCSDRPGFVHSAQYLNLDLEGGNLEGFVDGTVDWRDYDPAQDDPIYADPPALVSLVEEWMNLPGVVEITGDPSPSPPTLGTPENPQITVWNVGAGNGGGYDGCSAQEIDPQPCLYVPEGGPLITGYGILIVTGEFYFEGDFEFHGLVVQKSKKQLTFGRNNGTDTQVVHGAVLAVDDTDPLGCCADNGDRFEDTKVDIEDEAQILFNCQALNKYSRPITSGTGSPPVSVLSWRPL